PRELAVSAERTARSGPACAVARVSRRKATLRLSTVTSLAAAGKKAWGREMDGESQTGVLAGFRRGDRRETSGKASDFVPKRGCRWYCQRERTKCGPWISLVTVWRAVGNSAR